MTWKFNSRKGKAFFIHIKYLAISALLVLSARYCSTQVYPPVVEAVEYALYPEVHDTKPDLPSPFQTVDGSEYVVAVTQSAQFAIMEVTMSNERDICPQFVVDSADFPFLAQNGLHHEKTLGLKKSITGRPVDSITALGRPGALSQGGFMAEDEDIISVILGDNRIVRLMGLTHPQMAKPLFHVLNMMDTDLSLERWNMAKHQWENIRQFEYNGQIVFVEAFDTKGGQKSIFNDQMEGAFHIKLWREFSTDEIQFLQRNYAHLTAGEMEKMQQLLSFINTGEMEPQYIMRYGFYEGHTFWRADPIAISFIFGLKNLKDLHRIFGGKLFKELTQHFTTANEYTY